MAHNDSQRWPMGIPLHTYGYPSAHLWVSLCSMLLYVEAHCITAFHDQSLVLEEFCFCSSRLLQAPFLSLSLHALTHGV